MLQILYFSLKYYPSSLVSAFCFILGNGFNFTIFPCVFAVHLVIYAINYIHVICIDFKFLLLIYQMIHWFRY